MPARTVPTEIKRKRGTLRADRMPNGNTNLVPVARATVAVAPPKTLKAAGQAEWRHALEVCSWIAQSDLTALRFLCEAVDRREALSFQLDQDGEELMLLTSTGYAYANPILSAIEKTEDRIAKWMNQLGMTPSSRGALGVAEVRTASTLDSLAARRRQRLVGPPRWLTPVSDAARDNGDGDEVIQFVDAYGRITKDSIAGPSGAPLNPRGWQRRLIRDIFARDVVTDRRLHRTAMIGMGRKNGKTGLVAPIALHGLMLGGEGAEVYSAAADRPQAKLMLTAAKKTVELIPELMARLKLYRDVIEDPVTGSIYKALSADAYTKEGLSPTLVLCDELHAWPNRDLYDVLALAMGARFDPLMLIVTTAGIMADIRGQESIAHEMWTYGLRVASGEVKDPSFYMAWWAAQDNVDVEDPVAQADANPGLGDILDLNELKASAKRAKSGGFKESEYRIKRLNQWVTSSTVALPGGVFEALGVGFGLTEAEREVEKMLAYATHGSREPRVIFFDGSFSGDCTALVEVFLDGYMQVLGCWEKPHDDDTWRVPIAEVANTVYTAVRDTNVLEVAADPFRWQKELEDWKANDIPVIEFPTTSASRMVPAWAAFYDAVMAGGLSHDGDPRLERHMRNTVLKVDRLGPRPVKEHRGSMKSIDLAICAVGGYVRAMYHASQGTDEEPLIAWG